MAGGHVDRNVLSSKFQNYGDTYDDTKTEQAFETVAQQVDDNWDAHSAHKTAAVLDHPDGSVQARHIAAQSVTLDKLAPDIQTSGQPEVALSRVSVPSNRTFTTLKERLDTEYGATLVQFDKRGASVEKYLAKGDGIAGTDNTTPLNNAFAANSRVFIPSGDFRFTGFLTIPGNRIIEGNGYSSHLYADNTGGNTIQITGDNVVIRNLRLDGISPGGISIKNGAKNIVIDNCYFKDIGQCVWLFACSEVTVRNCTFDTTGYGVVQQLGFVSNNVKVINNTAKNMKSDFVEANCALNAPSKNWTISGNHYLGVAAYPTIGTETRFVGITAVENVTISDNIVEKSTGDGAIHLEDTKGDMLITGNILDNCVGAYPYIYLLNSAKTAIISNNIFKRTDTTIGTATAINLSSNIYSNDLLITGNRFVGTNQNLNGIEITSHDHATIVGNRFENCEKGIISFANARHLNLSANSFRGCNYGIQCTPGASGGSNLYWLVQGNQFEGTVTRCVDVHRSTNGTNPSIGWLFTGNYFDKDALAYDTQDFTAFANQCDAGAVINFGATQYIGSTRYNYGLNVVSGTGITGRSAAIADTTGAALAALETEVNKLKAALRTFGVIG